MIALLVIGIVFVFVCSGVRTIRPTHRGLLERFGKYRKYAEPGLHWIIPIVDRLTLIDVTENMTDAERQEIITSDNLNATVDALVWYKVKATEESVKAAEYNVSFYEDQIVSLARTTLRNIIGTMSLKQANSERTKINELLLTTLSKEAANWGIDVIRTELKEIDPPKDVQDTMNKVVKAENEKIAAMDFATAAETEADGRSRSAIKEAEGAKRATILRAEGERQASITRAEGEAKSIETVSNAAEKFFKGNAQVLRKLETLEECLHGNTKIIVAPANTPLINVLSDLLPGENVK